MENKPSNHKIPLSDSVKKLKNGLKMHTYKELSEDKGKMPELKAVEKDGKVQATYETKDGKTVSTSATVEAQKNGTYEESASKAGVKKEDLKYTVSSMAAAQAGVNQPKGLDNDKEAESAKLVKADAEKPKAPATSNTLDYKKINPPAPAQQNPSLDYTKMKAPENKVPNWKQKWDSKPEAEKQAFKQKLSSMRSEKLKKMGELCKAKLAKGVDGKTWGEAIGEGKMPQVNPKLTSNNPTHDHKGVKVKHLKDIGNGMHTVEIMEGEHKGKWTQAHHNDMKPLQKTEWKVPGLVPVVPDDQKMKKAMSQKMRNIHENIKRKLQLRQKRV